MFETGFPKEWSTLKKLIWLYIIASGGGTPGTITTVTGASPLALANALAKPIKSLTQYGKCVQDGTPTPDAPVDIVCNNGRVIAGNCISSIPDGQGTFITPSELTTNRVYKAFPTDLVVGRSYTVTVTGTNWLVLVQQKKPDGTGSSNVSGWVTTYDFTPEEGYIYGVAMRRSQDNITPADFNGTLTLDTTDGKPWAAGTPEVLTISCNEFDPSTMGAPTNVSLANADSTGVVVNPSSRSLIFPCEPNTTYTVSFKSTPTGGTIFRVATVAERVTSQNSPVAAIAYDLDIANFAPKTINTGSDAALMYLQFSAAYIGDIPDILVIQKGSAIIQPQTVNDVPMLLGVGDYKDEVELISGLLTHKVGVKVLTGDNTKDGLWGTSAGASNLYSLTIADSSKDNTFSPISTHFVGVLGSVGYASIQDGQFKHGSNTNVYYFKDASCEDLTAFKSKVAAAYAAGNPYIVLYPLATETTEQTTAHSLHSYNGTTVIDVTSEVDPVTLAAEYMASA